MSPLIGPDQDFAIWAVLLALAGFGFWVERFEWGRKYSGVMLLIIAAIILSNLRIIPTSAPAYDVVWSYLVPTAIPLLLFQADLKRVFRESGPTLVAFLIGSATVVVGVLIGVTLLDLGTSEAKLAGIFAGTYIGGSLNFAAVAEATGLHDSSLLAASVAADNVAFSLLFLGLIMLPGTAFITRHFPTRHKDHGVTADEGAKEDRPHRIKDLSVPGLLGGLALAFALAALGKGLAGAAGRPEFGILVITLLALVVSTAFPRVVAKLSGHAEAGNVLMFIFLASIGATADVWLLIDAAPILFLFASIIISVHIVLLLGIGKFFKFDIAELVMASAVCIGGPGIAPAFASARGWGDMLIPGVLCGSLGYAIGSFIGVSLAGWLG